MAGRDAAQHGRLGHLEIDALLALVDHDGRERVALPARQHDRFGELDISIAYTDRSVYELEQDLERHRDEIGRLAEIGATWVIVPGPSGNHPQASEFIQKFAELVIAA